MNRENLYRGKRKDNGEWVYGSALFYNDRAIIILPQLAVPGLPSFGWVQYEVIPETVGQFLGEPDTNGAKIFEGDIVQAPSNLAGTEFYIGTIEFGNFDDNNENIYTGFHIKWHNVPEYSTLRQSIIWWRDEPERFLKVIGNKWDNPELLKTA